MSLTKASLAELADHVRRASPGLSADRREELVQEAVAAALEQGPPDSESALLERAKAAVPALRNSERNRQRRGGRVQQPGEGGEMPLAPARRRPHRRPYVPKGLMPLLDDTAERLVPLAQAELPNSTTVAAARRLYIDVIEPAALGHPIAPDAVRAINDAYVCAFGEPPELAWASILTEEIQRAQRGIMEAKLASAAASSPNLGTADWSINVTKKLADDEAYPDLPREARLQLKPIRTYPRRGKVTVEVEAQYNGELVFKAFVDGTFGDVPPSVLGTTPAEHAAGVLVRALQRAAELGCGPLPEYVVDLELIAFLIARAGFDGGGGASGRLSGPSMLRLLADPRALADEVEVFGSRHAEGLPDDEADKAEARYREIANRIRECEVCLRDCLRTPSLPGQG